MRWLSTSWFLLLLAGLAGAQDEGCGCGEDEEDVEISIDGDGSEGGAIDIKVDPFDEGAKEREEPNKPPPARVGTWQPPDLPPAAQKEHAALLARRGERPDDVGVRYRLADFFSRHKWWPQAEAEYLACARADPTSIRPWEGLLKVYRDSIVEREDRNAAIRRIVFRGGVIVEEVNGAQQSDWLPSPDERDRRMTHAYLQIMKRRPDDVARRREFVKHLKNVRDHGQLVYQARAILERLPDDAQTRYDLATALRMVALAKERDEEGSGQADMDEAFRLMEENCRRVPDHAATLLRLARMVARRDGNAAGDRILDLEQRGFFSLFVRKDIAPVPYRADTFRMARDLVGPRIAGRLWEDLLVPDWYRNRPRWGADGTIHYVKWIQIHFPHAQPRDRLAAIAKLSRRADAEAAGILLAFLWHMEGADFYPVEAVEERDINRRVEEAACRAAAGMGGVCFPGAERFLRLADTLPRQRRAVLVMRGLKDPRGLRPLIDALAWETAEDGSLGVAAALEELGDPGAVDALVEAALDVRRPVPRRREAAEALAVFRDARSVEALRRLQQEQGFDLVAAYGLFRLTGDTEALPRLRRGLAGEEDAAEVVRLIEKCDDPRTMDLLLAAMEEAPRALRPRVVALLRARHWDAAKPRVHEILLEEASSPAVAEDTLVLLAEFPGKETADKLLPLCAQLKDKLWALAARALAETGDPRAVRYFARMKVLEKRRDRRRLARELYDLAAARRAQAEKQASGG